MYIIIDTNIFFNNWFLKSPQFSLLANFANNTNARLLLPRVVCMELKNKFDSESKATLEEIEKISRRCSDLKIDMKIEGPAQNSIEYDFAKIIAEKFDNVDIIEHDLVTHDILVRKAIKGQRPFRARRKRISRCPDLAFHNPASKKT